MSNDAVDYDGPSAISTARSLIAQRGLDDARAYVAERLADADETSFWRDVARILERES